MIKLLHISDIHLDRPFKSRSGKVKMCLKEAMRVAFQRAISYCIHQEVDVLLIAGDLFDGETVEPGTALFLKGELDRLKHKGIQVVYATGNHDCAQRIRALTFFKWPEHVHMVLSLEPQVIDFVSKHGEVFRVVACGHETPMETTNAVAKFPTKKSLEADLNATGARPVAIVGMAHSGLTHVAQGDDARYLPCSLGDLENLDYDYFALGHIHVRASYLEGKVGYSGCLQGVNRDEIGLKGAVYIEIEQGALKTSFVPLSGVAFLKTEVDVSEPTTLEDLGEALISNLGDEGLTHGIALAQTICTLQLKGRSVLKGMLEYEEAQNALKELIVARTGAVEVVIDISALGNVVDPEDYLETDTFLGHLLRTLTDPTQLETVLDDLMDELKLTTRYKDLAQAREWVREVLTSGTEELTERMVRHEEDFKS